MMNFRGEFLLRYAAMLAVALLMATPASALAWTPYWGRPLLNGERVSVAVELDGDTISGAMLYQGVVLPIHGSVEATTPKQTTIAVRSPDGSSVLSLALIESDNRAGPWELSPQDPPRWWTVIGGTMDTGEPFEASGYLVKWGE